MCRCIRGVIEARGNKRIQRDCKQPSERIISIDRIYPEGGLTEAEVERLTEQDGVPCGLGPRILRTETAPLYALSAISYQTELLRGDQ